MAEPSMATTITLPVTFRQRFMRMPFIEEMKLT
jgi:hypothetical protein